MKNNWENSFLTDIANISTGKWDANHATENGKYRFYTCAYEHLFSDTKRFEGECLILPGNGVNVGEVFYYQGDFDAYQRTYVISDIKILPRYLYYHMLLNWKSLGTKKQYGSATNFIKIKNFQDYQIVYPPLSEQKKIVEVLDQAFAGIEQSRQNTKQNLKNAKEIFESYLQGVFENKGDDWEVKTLGDVCMSASSNISQNKLANNEGDYPIYGASGLIKKVDFYHQDKPYLSIVKDGSGFGRVSKMDAYTSVIGTLQYILPKENIDLDYLNYSLMSVDFKKYVAGAAIPHIYFKDYKNEPFLWMPLSEQKKIVQELDALRAETQKLEAIYTQKLNDLDELKKSLLQKAFAGELVK